VVKATERNKAMPAMPVKPGVIRKFLNRVIVNPYRFLVSPEIRCAPSQPNVRFGALILFKLRACLSKFCFIVSARLRGKLRTDFAGGLKTVRLGERGRGAEHEKHDH